MCRVAFGEASDEDNCLVDSYVTYSEKLGIYDTSEKAIRRLVSQHNTQISIHEIDESYDFLKKRDSAKNRARDISLRFGNLLEADERKHDDDSQYC